MNSRSRTRWLTGAPLSAQAGGCLSTCLADPGGRVRVEAVREVIAARLRLVPRFRQLLYVTRPGLGRPL
jgi:hypothetical protein